MASRRGPLYWSLAGLFALSLHAAVAAFYLWHPASPPPPDIPAAAPFVVEMAMFMAAPEDAAKEMPPGPEQVESVKAPVTPPDVVEQKLPELPRVERPAEVPIHKPVVAERPRPEPEPEVEPEPEQPPEEYSEVSAPETTAPPSMNVAQVSDQVTAPMQGAFSQQQVIDAQQQWQQILHAHLERHKRSPRETRRKGVSLVSIVIDRQGQVLSVNLKQGSGVNLFDREALATIRRADPLPPLPAEMRGETLALTLPVQFNM
ncbi:energy transducer TonB family protein [Halopseudomonas xiamenensis]|uniref:energy transducer TonB family protein n=1 Tax=Halopseudomonas xiamenensis TaxID=157792 RepID=UPI0016258270|nr:energy transducer TonB [Halopseudomonas xiamenensis]